VAETELGKAKVGVRADVSGLDGDMANARSRITTALSGIALAGGAILGGAVAGGKALFGMAEAAAPLEGIQASFAGITGDADGMLSALREGTMGMVADADLMANYNQAAQLVGKTFADQLPDAMGYLGKVAAATGTDVGFMLDSLTKGVGRLSPMILDNLGIQVTLADATAQASAMFGVEEEALTKAQIQAGMMEVTLAALAENTAAMPDVSENAATKMAQLETTMANLKAELGTALLPIFTQVMGVMGELATEYGPQITAIFAQLAETLGPLLGSALETLIPAVMELLDALLPVAVELWEEMFPALSAILDAVIPLVAVLLEELAPVFMTLLEAILPVAITLIEMLVPVITEIISRLLPVFVPLITMLADVFGRLLLAVMPLVETLLTELVPVFLDIIEAVLPPLLDVLEVLLDVFVQYIEEILPVFTELLEIILPIIGDLAVLIAEGLGIALDALAAIIEDVVKPAMDWWIEHILKPIIDILDRIKIGIESVTEWFGNLTEKIREMDLPGWMTPGSPTPLELGLRGIGDELQRVDGLMGGLNATMTMQAVPAAVGATSMWTGNIVINGAGDPQATAGAVIRALQDRGILAGTMLR
jgi:phage-related protein